MNNNFRWITIVAALLLAAIVGVFAYNYGVTQGVEQSGKIVTAAPPAGAVPYPYYGWHRPWGFGFFFIPLFFFAFWIFVVRGLFWGRRWHHGAYGRCGGSLEEWHRREHERMWNEPPRGETTTETR